MADVIRLTASGGTSSAAFTFSRYRAKALPYLYVAPAIALFFLLMLFPMVTVFRYSLLDRPIMSPHPTFVGLSNFQSLFADPVFWQSIGNTLYFTIVSVVFHLIVGLSFA